MKTFSYSFEQKRRDGIEFEYANDIPEKLSIEDFGTGTPALVLNRSGMIALAKIMIKIALGDYSDTFHLHFRKDFDEDQPEVLLLALASDKDESQ